MNYRIISLISLLSSATLQAASFIWDGSTSGNWNTSANWTSNSVPTGALAAPDTLTFPTAGTTKVMANNLAAGLNFNRLSFTSDGYTLTGNGITLRTLSATTPTIQYAVTSGEATVNVPITLANSANFSTSAGGRLNLGAASDPALGGNTLTLTANTNGRIEVDGTTSGTGGVTMNGAGLVVLDASQNATGTYSLTAGGATLLTSTIAGPITTLDSTVLSAVNANASSNVTIAGDLSVGLFFDIAGNLLFNGGGVNDHLQLGIGGTMPGLSYDQIRVGGSVTTAAHFLDLDAAGGYPLGTEFVLISKTGAGAMTSTSKFLTPLAAAINEGSEVNYGSLRLRFSYAGGDGNDFTATVVPATSSGNLRIWDGGTDAANTLRTANNWNGDQLPIAGGIIRFEDGTTEKTVLNNGGGNYQSIQFAGTGGYLLQNDVPGNVGQLLMLSGGGLDASHTTSACTLAVPLLVVANQNWGVSGAGTLNIDAAATVELAGFNLNLNPTSTGTLNLNAPVSGSGNLNKDGSGLAVIGGAAANTYTGTTAVSRGELRLSKPGSAPAITGSVTIGGGANPATLSTTAAENIADSAVVTLQTNGTLQLGATETVSGMIYNSGTINNGANILALSGNFVANENLTLASPLQFNGASREITVASGKTLTLSGALSIFPGVFGVVHSKKGPGTLVFSGTAPAVAIQADAGVLQVDTTDAVNRPLISLNGGTVQGNGRSRQVTAATGGGTFTPGLGTGTSIWRTTGLAFNSATTVVLDLNSPTAGTGFDQLTVLESGTVSPGNAVLQIRDTQLHPIGTSFRIIDNDGTDAIAGTFASLPAGASIGGTFNRYTISYTGGTGNDVVLTVAAISSGVTRTWDGGGAPNRNWSTAANWSGDATPQPGDTLVFPLPSMSTGLGPVNDLPAGAIYNLIRFTGLLNVTGDFSISGNAIGLIAGIENLSEEQVNPFGRDIRLDFPITVQPGATIGNLAAANPRTLILTQAMTTTGGALRFVGRGGALPQGSITFSGNAATVTGNARLFVESNAAVNLNGFSTSTYSGGTEIIHGSLTGIPHARLTEGFVLTPGANRVAASIQSGTVSTGTSISVPSNGFLNGGPLLCANLTVAGEATLTSATVSGTTDVTGQLFTNAGTLQTGTLNLAAGATAAGNSLSATSLSNNNGTLSYSGSATIAGDLTVDGTDTCTIGTLNAVNFTGNGGTFSATNMNLSGDFTLSAGSITIPGSLTFPANPATHKVSVATGAAFSLGTLTCSSGGSDVVEKRGQGACNILTAISGVESIQIFEGTLKTDIAALSTTAALLGGTLAGSGTWDFISGVTGNISPGSSPGILTARVMDLAPALSLNLEIGGPLAGTQYDQIFLTPGGLADLDSAVLNVSLINGYIPLTGQVFRLIENTGTGPFTGALATIAEGSFRTISGITLQFSYTGGDGNDFTATVSSSPAGAFRVWDGGGADANWTTAQNWTGDATPLPGEALRFPTGALQLTNTNNFPSETPFNGMKVEGDYTLNGNSLILTGNAEIQPPGTAVLALPLRLDNSHAIILSGGGSLLRSGITELSTGATLTLRNNGSGEINLTGRIQPAAGAAADGGVILDGSGAGLVKFNVPTGNTYSGETWVQRGVLELTGASANEIPANLRIGGAGFSATVDNPAGPTNGRISNAADLIVETGGTHTLTGAAPIERITRLIMRGGSLVQPTNGQLIALDRIQAEGGVASTITTPVYIEASSSTDIDVVLVEAGSSLTLTQNSGIHPSASFNPKLRKTGTGALIIQAALTALELDCWEGSVITNAPSGQVNGTTILNGGKVTGNGTLFGLVNGAAANTPSGSPGGGILTPSGISGTGPARLTCAGNLLPASVSRLAFELGGTNAATQHDQIQVNGSALDLNRCALDLTLINGFIPVSGQNFTLITKPSIGSPTPRPFAGKEEGVTFSAAGHLWRLTYAGGDGNEVILTAEGPAPELTVTAFTLSAPPEGAAGRQITATLNGPATTLINLEASDDLQVWNIIGSETTNSAGTASFNTTDSSAGPRRFYQFRIP